MGVQALTAAQVQSLGKVKKKWSSSSNKTYKIRFEILPHSLLGRIQFFCLWIAGIKFLFTFQVSNWIVWYEKNTTSLLDKPCSGIPGNTHIIKGCVCIYVCMYTHTYIYKAYSDLLKQEIICLCSSIKIQNGSIQGDLVILVFWKYMLFTRGTGLSTTARSQCFLSSRSGSCGAKARWHSSWRVHGQPLLLKAASLFRGRQA